MQSVQSSPPDGEERITPGIIFAALYEEWRRHDSTFSMDFGEFIANPVRISTAGPSTLQEVVNAHASIYTQAIDLSAQLEHYSVHPLYPSVVIVSDRIDGASKRQADGCISLHEVAQKDSVLIVLTGSNHGSRISLKSLTKCALPVERVDAIGLDVVRVSISAAVQFFVKLKLQHQNHAAKDGSSVDPELCSVGTPEGYDHSIRCNREEWVSAVQVAAEKHEYLGISYYQELLLRVGARKAGRADYELEHRPFNHIWKP